MKELTLLMTGVMAVSLAACGATTGGLAQSLATKAALQSVSSADSTPSTAATAQLPMVDSHMDCAALTAELATVDAIITASNDTIHGAGGTNLAGQVAATGASQAALHSGAASALAKVPFGGFFAKKAMDTVANSGAKKMEQAQADLQNANLHKASLTGLYAGKNCAS